MDMPHYHEMVSNLDRLMRTESLRNKAIYIFGHCNASEELADLLLQRKLTVKAILDNNESKHGYTYREIPIIDPKDILKEPFRDAVVCIAARAYEAMRGQLHRIGYKGEVQKLVDYNSYAEYSLSEDTIRRKRERVGFGIAAKKLLEQKYPSYFKVFCPFAALGDVFLTMSYLPLFLKKRNITKCVVGVVEGACAQVVEIFGQEQIQVEALSQKDMDEIVQACIYTEDHGCYIAHQDRPYVIDLHRALYVKCIPLEQIYCCGIFGLPMDTRPGRPRRSALKRYPYLQDINKGKAVILSPYAKSVTALPRELWTNIVQDYSTRGYQCITNITGGEQPLPGTSGISPSICEIQSVVEWAGTYIGIRNGLCDVIKYARCRKTALYPDYQYCDTGWKAIDMYRLAGWENRVVKDGFRWKEY